MIAGAPVWRPKPPSDVFISSIKYFWIIHKNMGLALFGGYCGKQYHYYDTLNVVEVRNFATNVFQVSIF